MLFRSPVLTEQQRNEAVQQVLQQAAEAASASAEEPAAPPETEPVPESAAVLPETEIEEEHPDET